MKRATLAGAGCATALVVLAVAAGYLALYRDVQRATATSPAVTPASAPAATSQPAGEAPHGFLYGRITTVDRATYEGRLRWGIDQEAFWSDYFNGVKHENRWLAYVTPERQPRQERPAFEFLGIEIGNREDEGTVGRQLMARFGEITRLEARGREVRLTLKSGTGLDLDRFEASDFDDGVRVWDGSRGVVDLKSLRIRTIELLPTRALGAAPRRLHGTVRTRQGGDFTGFVAWNRTESLGTDELEGRTPDGGVRSRFDTIRSIARRSRDSSLVTLLDGRELVLSDSAEVGRGNRGVYVDDPRYGRVLVSWDSFERLDLSPGSSGPAYGDFPPGRPLEGNVTTRAGGRLTGRLVYDVDESETTDTLDAAFRGVDYNIPFGRIATIVPRGGGERDPDLARVTLHGGEELQLERSGDLAESNAGILVFVAGRERPDYVPWADVERVQLELP